MSSSSSDMPQGPPVLRRSSCVGCRSHDVTLNDPFRSRCSRCLNSGVDPITGSRRSATDFSQLTSGRSTRSRNNDGKSRRRSRRSRRSRKSKRRSRKSKRRSRKSKRSRRHSKKHSHKHSHKRGHRHRKSKRRSRRTSRK